MTGTTRRHPQRRPIPGALVGELTPELCESGVVNGPVEPTSGTFEWALVSWCWFLFARTERVPQ